jgi:cytochrome c-type biogenesis protein CcmH
VSLAASTQPPKLSGLAARRRAAAAAVATVIVWMGLCGARSSAMSLDDQVYAISRQLMCPVCQGQTVAESDSALAGEMKAIIRQKLVAGETPDQIVRYFVGQFGDGVLAEPRPGGVSLILYAGPPLALIAGAVIAFLFIRRAGARAASPDAPPDQKGVPPLRPEG